MISFELFAAAYSRDILGVYDLYVFVSCALSNIWGLRESYRENEPLVNSQQCSLPPPNHLEVSSAMTNLRTKSAAQWLSVHPGSYMSKKSLGLQPHILRKWLDR